MTPRGLLEFIAARLGRHVQSPGGLGGQCVDLIELWLLASSHPPVPGNAVDLLHNAPPASYEIIANGPANAPGAGDVIVWHAAPPVGISVYGHTAICIAADELWLLTCDQNWPALAPVALVLHSYIGVAGWLHPR